MRATFKDTATSLISKAVGAEEGEISNETITDGVSYSHVTFQIYGAEVIAETTELNLIEN